LDDFASLTACTIFPDCWPAFAAFVFASLASGFAVTFPLYDSVVAFLAGLRHIADLCVSQAVDQHFLPLVLVWHSVCD